MFYNLYMAFWIVCCLTALYVIYSSRKEISFFTSGYRKYLLQAWKVVTFLISSSALILVSPYAGDPNWDYVDATFISILTFLTAPWVIGVIYKQPSLKLVYVALCLGLFSASWSHDLYILMRDGSYPSTWLPNMILSSFLYIMAGLLWNLQFKEGKGVVLGFKESDWPCALQQPQFKKIFWHAFPIMLLAALLAIMCILPMYI